ncbi:MULTISPECIES: hypothetical protein [Cupriavidus]|uniref:hypothetical protein n=1 Tax=Cupriavidus TaxID=106589 RepID=UPI0025A8268C|nr:hypothetical protein [Cupriavidus sp. TKC]GMG91421.1 hypothetical protein Cmtc_26410 [Cupriavidus sp. TKC]
MPQLIEHIDAIARKAGRDVLYLTFFEDATGARVETHWEENPSRREIVAWLDKNGIRWQACGEVASDKWLVCGYRGSIYIDLPLDRELAAYRMLEQYLEHPDGTLRLPKMRFWALPLTAAMRNAHHDEPGYWEKRMEDF